MDAFLSFHGPGFWLVIALLAGVVALGVRPYLPPRGRVWSLVAFWVLPPYLALLLGGVSPRLMGIAYVDWTITLRLGVGLAFAILVLAGGARLFLLSGGAHQPTDAPSRTPPPARQTTAILLSGTEEWFWCFLRAAVTETVVFLRLPWEVPLYWSIWIAALLALPFALAAQPTALHRLAKGAILMMTSILFFYTRNFWLCWAVHAIAWLLLTHGTTWAAIPATGRSRS